MYSKGRTSARTVAGRRRRLSAERAEVEQVDGDLVHIGAQNNYVQLSAANFTRVKNAKTREEVDALVEELKLDKTWLKKLVLARAKSLAELREAAKKLGYKERFAEHRYKARHGEKALEEALALELQERIKGLVQEVEI